MRVRSKRNDWRKGRKRSEDLSCGLKGPSLRWGEQLTHMRDFAIQT